MSEELYDPITNPYAPGAGTPPPSLVGRDDIIDGADIAMRRVIGRRSSQHWMLTGLRGVGKTVLLTKLCAKSERIGYRVIRLEAVGGEDTVRSLLRQATRILTELSGGPKVARALKSIESVSLTVAGTGLALDRGASATQDREALTDVIIDVAAAAADDDVAILLAIDEAQLLDPADLRRILAGVHRCGQDNLPLWCLLAGLPNLVRTVARAATYAERMFAVSDLGPLSTEHVGQALVEPARDIGVDWTPEATQAVIDHSDGYPFFVQTWAYHTWNCAHDEPISAADVDRASSAALHALDTSFFTARIARIPDSEVAYVQALARLGPGQHRSGAVAEAMKSSTPSVAAYRDRLIAEGVIYSPRYGWVEFAIPHFDEYVRRSYAE